jgi:hypothetical protein
MIRKEEKVRGENKVIMYAIFIFVLFRKPSLHKTDF